MSEPEIGVGEEEGALLSGGGVGPGERDEGVDRLGGGWGGGGVEVVDGEDVVLWVWVVHCGLHCYEQVCGLGEPRMCCTMRPWSRKACKWIWKGRCAEEQGSCTKHVVDVGVCAAVRSDQAKTTTI